MKYSILFIFCLVFSNLFAQLEYEESIEIILERTGINLSVPDGFNLVKQTNRKGNCHLLFEKAADDLKVKYVISGTRDYMKGLSDRKKKSAKEKKEEAANFLHPNSSYEQTFGLLLMNLNNKKYVPSKTIDKGKLNTTYFADWGGVTGIFENANAEENEGKYNVGFCLHKKDFATIYVFMSGNNQETLYEAVGEIIYKISFEKAVD